jgi:hypothetical protein
MEEIAMLVFYLPFIIFEAMLEAHTKPQDKRAAEALLRVPTPARHL